VVTLIGLGLALFFYRLSKTFDPESTNFAGKQKQTPEFAAIAAQMAETLRRYQPEPEFSPRIGYRWAGKSKLYTLTVALRKKGRHYEVSIFLSYESGMQFNYEPGNPLPILDPELRQLSEQPEFSSIAKMLRFFDSLSVQKSSIYAKAEFKTFDNEEWMDGLKGLFAFVHFIHGYRNRKQLPAEGTALCPYCRSDINESDQIVTCQECRTAHHAECWNEIDGCAVFGCSGKTVFKI